MCGICLSSDNDGYNDFISDMEMNFNFDSIGKTYKTTPVDSSHFAYMNKATFEFKVEKLYKYQPQKGYAPIQQNTRRFCRKLYIRSSGSKYFTLKELQAMITPGKKYGQRDVLLNCGNYSANPQYTTCRHRWVRYLRDTETGAIVIDPKQPKFHASTAK